jgi:type II secretory pathway pseudopilin PulG
METIPSSEQIINDNGSMPAGEIVKCGNCDYIGPALNNRSLWAQIVSWILIIISPFITMLYYVINPKYVCSKCKSKFVSTKDEDGVYRGQSSAVAALLFVIIATLVSIAIVGILSSIVLASLSVAKEKGRVAAEKANSSLTATTTVSTTTVMTKNTKSGFDTSKNLSQDDVQAVVDYVKRNSKLPKEIDENTTWLSVSADQGLVIKYEYMIQGLDVSGFSSNFLKNFILEDACSNSDVKDELLDKGVVLRYKYSVKDSTKTFDFNIDKNDCK